MNPLTLSIFRTKLCTNTKEHNKIVCPFAHEGMVKAGAPLRRNPSFVKYIPVLCVPFTEGKCKNPRCEFAHSTSEIMYHPVVYRTRRCKTKNCKFGTVCAFYHDGEKNYERVPYIIDVTTPYALLYEKLSNMFGTSGFDDALQPGSKNFRILELRGDSVLYADITRILTENFDYNVANISDQRQKIISNVSLSNFCDKLNLVAFIPLAHRQNIGKKKGRADIVEAFIGALDVCGTEEALSVRNALIRLMAGIVPDLDSISLSLGSDQQSDVDESIYHELHLHEDEFMREFAVCRDQLAKLHQKLVDIS